MRAYPPMVGPVWAAGQHPCLAPGQPGHTGQGADGLAARERRPIAPPSLASWTGVRQLPARPPRRRAAGIARVVESYRSLVRLLPAGGQEPCEASAVTASAVNRPHRMGNVGTRPAGGRSGGTMCMRLTPPSQAFSHGSINYRAPSCPRSTSQLASTSPISSHSHSDRRPADLMEGLPIQRG